MKKLIAILVVLLVAATVQAEDGWTIWGMTSQNIDSRNNDITGRIGYQVGQFEPFIGSTWWPQYDDSGLDMAPPQVFSLGCVYHWQDILDPNNPLPWVPEILSIVVPEGMIATPYFGGQATINIDHDSGYTGAVVGLLIKGDSESNASFVAELNYNDMFNDLAMLPDKIRMTFGFRFCFNANHRTD